MTKVIQNIKTIAMTVTKQVLIDRSILLTFATIFYAWKVLFLYLFSKNNMSYLTLMALFFIPVLRREVLLDRIKQQVEGNADRKTKQNLPSQTS